MCGQHGPVIQNVPKPVVLDQNLEQGIKSRWRKIKELAQDREVIRELAM